MTLPFSMATYVRYRQTHAGGTHMTGASATSMRVWVCRCLCAINRVFAPDACVNPTAMVMELTSSTPVKRRARVRGFSQRSKARSAERAAM